MRGMAIDHRVTPLGIFQECIPGIMCVTSQNITIQMRDVGVWGGGGNISIVNEKEPLEEYKGEEMELGDFEDI